MLSLNEELECLINKYKDSKKDKDIKITNEDLVDIIQNTNNRLDNKYKNINEECWELLQENTIKAVHAVFHKYVNNYYKINMKDDIYTVLKQGWVKSVLTYDKEKATGPFHPYASYLMYQSYIQFANRITPDKIGRSKRDDPFSSVNITSSTGSSNEDNLVNGCETNILIDHETEYNLEAVEEKHMVHDILNYLDEVYPGYRSVLTEYVINKKNQREVAKQFSISQMEVSRRVKTSLSFLKEVISQEVLNI